MNNDLCIESLSFRYGAVPADPVLKNASAKLTGGTSVALLGKNGSGKSTLCKILNGVLEFSSGQLTLTGKPIRPFANPGRYVAYSYQNPDDQIFLPTVSAELEYGPVNQGMKRDQIGEATAAAAKLFRLEDVMDSNPFDLPFSTRKRIAMAGTVASARPWIVIDEPTLGQDPASCIGLADAFRIIQKAGHGMIIISHDHDFIFEVCDHILLLDAGDIAWSGPVESFSHVDKSRTIYSNLYSKLSLDMGMNAIHHRRRDVLNELRGYDGQ